MCQKDQPAILVVEDDPAVRRVIVRTLTRNHFTVHSAENATGALETFKSQPVHLAIVDMIMPGMSGLDLAAEIERRKPGTPILYISGHGDSIAMESIARRKPTLVLIKPFAQQVLVDRIHQMLEQNPTPEIAPK